MVLLVRLSNFSTRLVRLETQMLDQAQKMRDLACRLDEKPKPTIPVSEVQTEESIKQESSTSISEITSLEIKAEPNFPDETNVPKAELRKEETPEVQRQKDVPSGRFETIEFKMFRKIKSTAELETLVGGNVLNRIGALALIFGIGFFLKYAFDNDWISPVLRVLISVVIGVGLMVGGVRANVKKFEVFSQGLFGAGISTLYLSIYAALNFYQLVPQAIAFLLMSAVTSVALLAVARYESRAISLLGWAGGFLTSFLLASAEPNAVGLFVYLALLNLGMIAVAFLKTEWVVIELLSMGATFLVYALWLSEHGEKTGVLTKAFFLTLFWFLFLASEAYRALNDGRGRLRLRAVLSTFNGACYFGCLYASVMPAWWLGFTTVLIAGVYLALFWTIRKRNPAATTELTATYSIGAIVFTAVAIEVQFADFLYAWAFLLFMLLTVEVNDVFLKRETLLNETLDFSRSTRGMSFVIIWLFYAVALLWFGAKKSSKSLVNTGLFVLVLGVVWSMVFGLRFEPIEMFFPILNLRALAFLLAIGGTLATIALLEQRNEGKSRTAELLRYVFGGLLFVLLTVEAIDYFRWSNLKNNADGDFYRALTLVFLWTLYATTMLYFGIEKPVKPFLYGRAGICALGSNGNLRWIFV